MVVRRVFDNSSFSRFNVAAWANEINKHVVLVGREIEKGGLKGEPDKGKLFLVELDENNSIIHERIIWEPTFESLFLEDPRALIIDNDTVIIGLTAVLRKKKGFEPFPSFVKVSLNSWREILPPVTIIQTFGPGKNITPVSAHQFFFRPEDNSYSHKLLLFSINNYVPKKTDDLHFPTNLEWAKWRIGTTMPPLWIDDNNAIMIIHGITIDNGRYIYSLGRARLKRENDKYQIDVAPDPIVTPTTLRQMVGLKIRELHPRLRRVVYACGGVVNLKDKNALDLYVNVGDTDTYEIKLPMEELKKDLF